MIPSSPARERRLDVQIRKRFLSRTGPIFTLDVEFAVGAGFTILFGASGSGKTSVLDCIAGLQNPDFGHVAVGETMLFDSASGANLPPSRRKAGYLLQSLALFPHMTVEQNVQYGLAGLSKLEREKRSHEVLESFRISSLAGRRPGQISGGERQRAALARALVTQPRVLLLDEPLSALDATVKARIVDDLRTWNRQNQIPVLYVTHERGEVFGLGERVMVLDGGRIVAQGSPHEVLQSPKSETVAQLAGFENIFDCSVTASHTDQGTMTCRIPGSAVDLEVPLIRVDAAKPLRVGIRAGDILLASSAPQGLSARNILSGVVESCERHDAMVVAKVNCGATFEVHLTPGAVASLGLKPGLAVWLIIKTYSCQLLQ
jgi:molybdate transport system ATP-binding protein